MPVVNRMSPYDESEEVKLRRNCREGTKRYQAALIDAGYMDPPKEPEPIQKPPELPKPTPQEILAELKDRINMQDVAEAVAKAHDVSVALLKGKSRNKNVCRARHEAFSICHHSLGHSYPTIGRFFNKDHTTVLHGIRRHNGWPPKAKGHYPCWARNGCQPTQ